MASVGFHCSKPAGEGILGVHADDIDQGHGFSLFTALTAVVLTDGGTLLKQLMQVIREACHHGSYKFIDWFHEIPWVNRHKKTASVGGLRGMPRMASFGVYATCGFSMAGGVVTGVSAKRSHRASKVASVQVLGT